MSEILDLAENDQDAVAAMIDEVLARGEAGDDAAALEARAP